MIRGKKKERDVEIPSSSMADIAFLLLVFFLLTTTIDMEKGLDLTLPGDDEKEVKIPPENLTNILIDANGNVLMKNQQIKMSEIKDNVMEKIRNNPNMVFSLKTVRDTPYEDFIECFDQLKAGGAKKISIADPDES